MSFFLILFFLTVALHDSSPLTTDINSNDANTEEDNNDEKDEGCLWYDNLSQFILLFSIS